MANCGSCGGRGTRTCGRCGGAGTVTAGWIGEETRQSPACHGARGALRGVRRGGQSLIGRAVDAPPITWYPSYTPGGCRVEQGSGRCACVSRPTSV